MSLKVPPLPENPPLEFITPLTELHEAATKAVSEYNTLSRRASKARAQAQRVLIQYQNVLLEANGQMKFEFDACRRCHEPVPPDEQAQDVNFPIHNACL